MADEKKMAQAVSVGSRTFVPGEEAELAKVLSRGDADVLIEREVLPKGFKAGGPEFSGRTGDAGAGKPAARKLEFISEMAKHAKPRGTSKPATADDEELPPIRDLTDHVAGLKSVDEVKAMAKRDDRVSAEPIYKARIAELEEK